MEKKSQENIEKRPEDTILLSSLDFLNQDYTQSQRALLKSILSDLPNHMQVETNSQLDRLIEDEGLHESEPTLILDYRQKILASCNDICLTINDIFNRRSIDTYAVDEQSLALVNKVKSQLNPELLNSTFEHWMSIQEKAEKIISDWTSKEGYLISYLDEEGSFRRDVHLLLDAFSPRNNVNVMLRNNFSEFSKIDTNKLLTRVKDLRGMNPNYRDEARARYQLQKELFEELFCAGSMQLSESDLKELMMLQIYGQNNLMANAIANQTLPLFQFAKEDGENLSDKSPLHDIQILFETFNGSLKAVERMLYLQDLFNLKT